MIENKEEHYKRYGWTCSEENLATLPATAPQGVKALTKWLVLESRRSTLEEYLGLVKDDKIHGKFWHIGAWTQRMSHSSPNQANLPSVFTGDPTTPVEEVKAKYDSNIRGLFTADSNSWLVGTDAEGIQLRVLAHYINDKNFTDSIVNGDKSLGTDVHSTNKNRLGAVCKDRDTAKTFVYAWLLGAGIGKIAQILGCSHAEAKKAVDNFVTSLPGLKKLKTLVIPRDAARGYFIGLDGRKVPIKGKDVGTREHLALSGYLQNGEAVIMKKATLKWKKALDTQGIKYELVNLIHDEWQTISKSLSLLKAQQIGHEQCKSLEDVGKELKLNCPLAGSYKVGTTWADTH